MLCIICYKWLCFRFVDLNICVCCVLKDLDDNMVVYFSRIDVICIYML